MSQWSLAYLCMHWLRWAGSGCVFRQLNMLGSKWIRLSLNMCRCGSSFLIQDWIYITEIATRENCREKLAGTVFQLDDGAAWKKTTTSKCGRLTSFTRRDTHTDQQRTDTRSLRRCEDVQAAAGRLHTDVRLGGLRFRPKGFFMQTTSVAFRADAHSTAYSPVCLCVCVCLVICAASPPVCTDVVTVHLSARRSLPSVQKQSCL